MLNIPISTLKPHIAELTQEEIINLLNSMPVIKKQSTAPIKGKTLEITIENSIKSYNITKSPPHAGDYIIYKEEYPQIKIMLEIKNYSSTVPIKEYEKFLYDLQIGKYAGGIFITKTPVQGLNYSTYLFKDNIIIIEYENNIEIFCDLLWLRLYDRYNYKFLDSPNKLKTVCDTIEKKIMELVRLKSENINIQKYIKKYFNSSQKIIENITQDLRETIGEIMTIYKPVSIYNETQEIIIPFTGWPVVEEFIKKLIAGRGPYILAEHKNTYEYNFRGEKYLFTVLKTKITVSFKIEKFCEEMLEAIIKEGYLYIDIKPENIDLIYKILEL